MKRKHRSGGVSAYLTVGDDQYVTATANVSKRTPAYFDRSFGNWLPGDDSEVSDIELVDEAGTLIDFDSLSQHDQAAVEEALMEAASECDAQEYDPDDARDAQRDRDWDRGEWS